ncbi:lectin-like [Brienomyrus brachyistius]|uniref:lectin-like n=2 Tax=Brienomyrus brachyistius TaxID=42636 RepID=UPI0020B3A24C|nr:lectin-like [Brienomyrus brachyistius]XP_048826639.1 lectin-like [Brienomyrus brachyistius]
MRGAVGLKSRDMRTPSLLGVALLWLFAMPAATDDDHQHPSNSCDGQYKDWTQIGQVCAKYFNTPSSFADAESACRQAASGGHLVSVHDEQTNAAVLAIVLKYNPSSPRTWMGGERVGQSSTFTWTDGSSWDFEKWVPGQPSNSGNHENCVEMNWKNLGQWNDDWCIKQKPFICAFQWQHQRLD